jgi:hypothetical protein
MVSEPILNRVESRDILIAQEIALGKIFSQLEGDLAQISTNVVKNPAKKPIPSTIDKKK